MFITLLTTIIFSINSETFLDKSINLFKEQYKKASTTINSYINTDEEDTKNKSNNNPNRLNSYDGNIEDGRVVTERTEANKNTKLVNELSEDFREKLSSTEGLSGINYNSFNKDIKAILDLNEKEYKDVSFFISDTQEFEGYYAAYNQIGAKDIVVVSKGLLEFIDKNFEGKDKLSILAGVIYHELGHKYFRSELTASDEATKVEETFADAYSVFRAYKAGLDHRGSFFFFDVLNKLEKKNKEPLIMRIGKVTSDVHLTPQDRVIVTGNIITGMGQEGYTYSKKIENNLQSNNNTFKKILLKSRRLAYISYFEAKKADKNYNNLELKDKLNFLKESVNNFV